MDRILEIDAANRIAVVQPGVSTPSSRRRRRAARALLRAGSVEPARLHDRRQRRRELRRSAHAQVRHDHQPRARARARAARRRARASSARPRAARAGLDLVGAVVGSEGTLGIVTAATVRLDADARSASRRCSRSSRTSCRACRAVGAHHRRGTRAGGARDRRPAHDRRGRGVSVYAAGLPLDAGAVLIVELDGAAVALPARGRARARRSRRRAGATRVEVARDDAERARFWRARKGAFGAMGRLAPDLYVHDAVVPRTKLPEVIERGLRDRRPPRARCSRTSSTRATAICTRTSPSTAATPTSSRACSRAGAEILELCVAAGGVITGEHGSRHREARLHGPGLRRGRPRRDAAPARAPSIPTRVCNPGKMLPTPRFCAESNPKARGYDRVPFA